MPELYRWAQLFRASTWEEVRMVAGTNAAIEECVFTYKELSADEEARMQSEAREDFYRRLNGAEKWGMEQGIRQGIQRGLEQGIEQGIRQGHMETACTLVSNIEHAMKNFRISLEQACEGLGTTAEAYRTAKEMTEDQ